jgi:hypothetical protein
MLRVSIRRGDAPKEGRGPASPTTTTTTESGAPSSPSTVALFSLARRRAIASAPTERRHPCRLGRVWLVTWQGKDARERGAVDAAVAPPCAYIDPGTLLSCVRHAATRMTLLSAASSATVGPSPVAPDESGALQGADAPDANETAPSTHREQDTCLERTVDVLVGDGTDRDDRHGTGTRTVEALRTTGSSWAPWIGQARDAPSAVAALESMAPGTRCRFYDDGLLAGDVECVSVICQQAPSPEEMASVPIAPKRGPGATAVAVVVVLVWLLIVWRVLRP